MPIYLRPLAIALASLVLPPVGLVLLWIRRGPRVIWKLLLSVVIVLIGFVHLILFYGLGVEMYGGGMPRLRFERADAHERELEASRAAQARAAPERTPEPQVTAEPVTAAATQPEQPQPAPPPAATAQRPAGSTYWTDFRGPGRLGHYDQAPILTTWPADGLTRLWKQPIGGGYASFAVARGVAFTIEQRRDKEVVAAYDLRTGRERWTVGWPARFSESMGGDGPRATPVWDDGRLYALGAAGEFRCLDAADGKTLWRTNILDDNGATNAQWGMAASPLIADQAVIVQPGGPAGRSVVAYDKRTGARLWNSLDDKAGYTSAVLATLDGRPQVLTMTATRAVGLSLADGSLLWEFPWVTQYGVNAVEPIVVGPNRVFIASGYGKGSAVLQVVAQGDRLQASAVWSNNRMKARFNGPVVVDGHVYGLDEGILQCVDVATGDQKWKGGRYGYGQLLLASGHLVILTEDGDVALVRPTPEKLDERARFSAIDGKTWNYPAISDGVLLVRNAEEMAAFAIGAK